MFKTIAANVDKKNNATKWVKFCLIRVKNEKYNGKTLKNYKTTGKWSTSSKIC